ncbi:MAG: tRNA threonylcarbamoyladenosine dehydratase [Kiritimatiellia bacterium]
MEYQMQHQNNIFKRTEALIGSEALRKLADSSVAVFGIGGVGSYAAEALARGGIGHLTLIDSDTVAADNINRQIPALVSTIGQPKARVMAERINKINPEAEVISRLEFYLPENSADFDLSGFSYVIDAVDTVAAKVELAVRCAENSIPLISCMGTGNKMDPCSFKTADIYETSVCPLCKVMRKELKKREVKSLRVIYSTEKPLKRDGTPASISYVPPVAGLITAGEVIRALVKL